MPWVGSQPVVSEDRLGELYRAQGTDALRLAYVLTGDVQAAEDITQEAFYRIGRKIFGLRDPDHERAYLLRTVVNLSRTRGRKLERERKALARLEPVCSSPAPEADEAWKLLLSLPPRQRAALFLRFYLDRSEADAADALDCSTSALKSLVNRGLHTLRALENQR